MLHLRGQTLPDARTPTMTLVQTRCTLKFRLQGAKEYTSCPKMTSPVCSRNVPSISEAHWKPLNPSVPSLVPSITWSFLHIHLHPLENPAVPKQARSPWSCCGSGTGPLRWLLHSRVNGQDGAQVGQMKDQWVHFTN